jgi:hypothetical protein
LNREELARLSPHPTPLTVPVNKTAALIYREEQSQIKYLGAVCETDSEVIPNSRVTPRLGLGGSLKAVARVQISPC